MVSRLPSLLVFIVFFFFNDTATTEIYTLSLHDALPISITQPLPVTHCVACPYGLSYRDRKSTRLNSSHQIISYAVFCLKKKTNRTDKTMTKKQKQNKHNNKPIKRKH